MEFLQPQDLESQFQTFNSIIGIGSGFNNTHYQVNNPAASCQGLTRLLKGIPVTGTDNSAWSLRDEFEQELTHQTPLLDKMETEVIMNTLNGGGNEFKGDFVDNNPSRSCSPSVEGQTNENGSAKGNKIDASKVCGVCGDKALGNNFNAITCESCKAFFRRNALKPKDFVCPFNDNCKVDPVTRRFCQKCRLKKCFDIGMKKEWIMTDEEKKMKKQKIEQNRLKRQSSDAPPCGNDGPLAKNSCIFAEDQESNSPVTQDPLASISPEDHRDSSAHLSDSGIPIQDDRVPKHIIHTSSHHPEETKHCIVSVLTPGGSLDPCSYDNSSNSSEASAPHPTRVHEHDSTRQFNKMNGHDNYNLCSPASVGVGPPSPAIQRSQSHVSMNGSNVLWHIDPDALEECPSARKILISQHSSHSTTASMGKSRLYGLPQQHVPSNVHPDMNGSNYELNHTPLLSSLIRPGLAESPPDADLIDCSGSHIVARVAEPPPAFAVLHSRSEAKDYPHRIPPSSHSQSHIRERDFISSGHYLGQVGSHTEEEETIPLPLNTMDSILSVAITAEYNSYGMHGRDAESQSRELNKAERAKLNELRSASQALHAPVDAEGPFKLTETSDPSLINVINLTDIAIRRLIQMSKKISGFKNMCQEDQIALLKGSCTEMMILRSAVSYDPDRDSWNIPHSFGYNIKLGVLKEARGNLYEEHQRFVRSFKSVWREDENIMIILCAITLFTAERPNVVHKDVVKLEQDSYYYLLKRYLESTLNGCDARSTYLQLIRKIAELHELNSNHLRVFLEVNPREVEPLLIEIFDLKQ